MTETPLRYRVDLSKRAQHLVDVTMTVPADVASGARIVLATWTPGSYVERNYVHHVQSIAATHADGTALALTSDTHTSWRLPEEIQGDVTIELEVYGNDLTVRTNHVDGHHALIIPAATFPFVEGAEHRRHEVTIPTPEGQQVWSLLPAADAEDTYVAQDLDHLIDSAFEVGDFPVVEYEVAGVPHRFVYAAHGGRPDMERIGHDCEAIGEAAVELFDGDLPIEDYTFLHVGWDSGGGGLEHRDGAVLMKPVLAFQDPDQYASFQSLVAHEYLHLWNVKRLVPKALTELTYDHPTHTTSLWVAEGWTAYYDELLPLRAGLWSLKRYLGSLRDNHRTVTRTPGAALQSVQESSFHAWTSLYVRDENWSNKGVNYYGHGALLAWSLDLLIRREDPDGHGLDAAFRLLWERHGADGSGYTEDDVIAAVNEVAGTDLSDVFARHVAGRSLPPIEDLVDTVGLRFAPAPRKDDDPQEPARLGITTAEDDGGVTIASVLRGQPGWHAGLTGGDRLLAVDGHRVARGQLATLLRGFAPGETVDVTVFRGPRLLTVPVTLGEPLRDLELQAVEDPTEAQRTAFRRWTGRDLGDVAG